MTFLLAGIALASLPAAFFAGRRSSSWRPKPVPVHLSGRYKTPQSVAAALRNAFMQIRALEFERGHPMPDQEQLEIAVDHVSDFLGGKAFVSEWRHEAIRAFIAAVCPDSECVDELERAIAERRAA